MTSNTPRPVTDTILNFVGGSYRKGSQGKTFANINPATGQTTGTVHEASEADVADAVAAARAALGGPWGKMTTAERVKLIVRSEENTSELQSLMRISYAVFCLKKKRAYSRYIQHIDNKDT